MRQPSTLGGTKRPTGLKIIIGYKMIKTPAVLSLALWLTVALRSALHSLQGLASQLETLGPSGARLGAWLATHLSRRVMIGVAVVAWLDVATTTVEVVLLLKGRPAGESMVALGLAVLLVLEMITVTEQPSLVGFIVLSVNAAVVAYMVGRRLRRFRHGIP